MRVLVIGGTSFLGRALVGEALSRGWQVTTFNRGLTGTDAAGVEALRGDRSTEEGLAILRGREWELAVDTSGYVPRLVRMSSKLLSGRVGHYGFVSTVAVYPDLWNEQVSEDSPVFDCSPDEDWSAYGHCKAGCERAISESFDQALHVRAGVILGPYENVGRLPWWLNRLSRGGEVLAPGPAHRRVQFIDARDIARWMCDCAQGGVTGAFNVSSKPGVATMGSLLETVRSVTRSSASLTWVDEEWLVARGVAPDLHLPIWMPQALRCYDVSVDRAFDAGLTTRSPEQTVADTWDALQRDGETPLPELAGVPVELPTPGLAPAREAELLEAWRIR